MTYLSQSVGALLCERYRCPQVFARFRVAADLSPLAGFFRLNEDLIGYGHLAEGCPAARAKGPLPRARHKFSDQGTTIRLPFNPVEVIANLRFERYMMDDGDGTNGRDLLHRFYYLLRPFLSVTVRKHAQRFRLRGWQRIPFPEWPVDRTVERLYEWLLVLAMQAEGISEAPFIWFWPDGHSSCATITHDVETDAGRDFCAQLMDINDSYGVKSSFQIVPEQRYEVPASFLDCIRSREFEVNIHDLNHDGHLFNTREQFLKRVAKINRYGKEFRARGFRSAVLYRKLHWMHVLDFAYDMSAPNVAHLDPQRGGCCTLLPYSLGDLIEIPVTTTQDYSLFHVLRQYSTKLWEQQVTIIDQAYGLASFIVHPDYLIDAHARKIYEQLLSYLVERRKNHNLWIARPGEINDWWRLRNRMNLVQKGNEWRVEGAGSERARVAYAHIDNDRLVYRLENAAKHGMSDERTASNA